MGVAAACIAGGVAITTTAATIGAQEMAKNDASDAARNASDADARARALEAANTESQQAAGGIMGMMGPAGGDPTVQGWLDQANKDYLAQRGLLQQGAQPGGAVPGQQQGQPGQPVDPSNPSQPTSPSSNYRPPGLGK